VAVADEVTAVPSDNIATQPIPFDSLQDPKSTFEDPALASCCDEEVLPLAEPPLPSEKAELPGPYPDAPS